MFALESQKMISTNYYPVACLKKYVNNYKE